MLAVPCTPSGVSCWTQRTTLDGASFVLKFDWYGRDGKWRLSLADADGVPIRTGIVLVTGVRLLARVVHPRRPRGDLAVIDATGANDVDPGFSDLGARFRLYYITAEELGR